MPNKYNFALVPSVHKGRTRIHMPHRVLTSMSVGNLYPIDLMEVLPGDTININCAAVARVSSAFLKPVLDNVFLEVHAFFVPLRQVYDSAEKVFGLADPTRYSGQVLAQIPVTTSLSGDTITSGTVADYLGLPVGIVGSGISILPFRAFAKIYNEWFRNENVISEMYIQKGQYMYSSEKFDNAAWSANHYTGKLPKVAKVKDMFTACLPKPQKGNAVQAVLAGTAPVNAFASTHPVNGVAESFVKLDGTSIGAAQDMILNSAGQTMVNGTASVSGATSVTPNNLYADLSQASGFAINDLRFAWQLQKMLEVDARYGSRYGSYLYGHYGVQNPDLRIQFTEYLGGARIPINIQQVPQTSESSANGSLGDLGAFSLSVGKMRARKSASEHGYLLTVACLKTVHTYSQGIEKLWFRKSRDDFYDPLYANLGEQPIYQEQLFGTFTSGYKQIVFGYNEYGCEYRFLPNRLTGQMRPKASTPLDIWHFGDEYASAPTLSASFVEETPDNVDRTLAVPSSSMDQFIVDFGFDTVATRVMPLRSIPGLVDHG